MTFGIFFEQIHLIKKILDPCEKGQKQKTAGME